MNITIEDQIKCVRREIAMRRRVYPRLVQRETMTQEQAAYELESMEAALRTLEGQEAPPLFQ